MSEDTVTLEIGRDQALVLFELLADYNMESTLALPNEAERIAVNLLVGVFEKSLVEPFKPKYLELVNSARVRLLERYGSSE